MKENNFQTKKLIFFSKFLLSSQVTLMDGFICFLSVLVTIVLLSLYPFKKYVTKQIIQHQNVHIYIEFDRNSKIKPLKHAYEPIALHQYDNKNEPLQIIIC